MLIFLCPTFLSLPSAHPITRQLSSPLPPTQSDRRKDTCENPPIAPNFIRYCYSKRIADPLEHDTLCKTRAIPKRVIFLISYEAQTLNGVSIRDQMAGFSQE